MHSITPKLGLCRFLLVIVGLSLGNFAFSQNAQISFDDEEIDAIIEQRVGVDKEIMGLGLAVVHNGKIVYSRGYGYEDHGNDIKVKPGVTRFRWASVSKTLTAATAVIGDSLGIDLDSNVEDLYAGYSVPQFYFDESAFWGINQLTDSQRVITMRQLLTHTSGIQHYTNGWGVVTPPGFMTADPNINTGMEWALPTWTSAPLLFRPGTDHSYSTPAYNLAGVILEERFGLPFETLVQNLIGSAAGMTTLRADTVWNPAPNRAVGYIKGPNGIWIPEADDDVSWKLAGGGFVSTVVDMGRYAAALMDGAILTDAELDRMWEPQTYSDGELINNGRQLVGWFKRGEVLSHSGSQSKAQCLLTLVPDLDGDQLGIAIMTNMSFLTKIDLGSIESEIRNLIEDRLENGEKPIDAFDLSILSAVRQTSFAQQSVYSTQALSTKSNVRRDR